MTYDRTVDEFLELIQPELERQVDEMILLEPEQHARLTLMRHRDEIVRRLVDHTKIVNLRHRLAEAEERLRPRLVETAE